MAEDRRPRFAGAVPVSWERKLAELSAGVRYESMPAETVATIKTLLLDTLGCALGALGCDPARMAERAAAKAWPGGGKATVIGSGARAGAEAATLVNGSLIRYLDFNDLYEGLEAIHPSENIATALACCEEAGADGKRLIEAILVGYEGHIRFSEAYAFTKRGLHPVAVAGWVAPMIAGKAWGLSAEAMAHAIGLSGSRCQTLTVVNRGEISMAKATGYAFPSMEGVFCARLAAEGFTGPEHSVQWLFDKVQPVAEGATLDLDMERLRIGQVSLKRFAVQFELQSVVEAAIEVARAVGARKDKIAELHVGSYPRAIERGADAKKFKPTTRETADHSLPVCAALALLDGKLTAEQFDGGRWKDPDVAALLARTKATVDEALVAKRPKGRGARVTVRLADGTVLAHEVEIPEGDSARPLTAAKVEAKFMEQALPAVGEARARKIIDEVARIERAPNLGSLMAALTAGA
jgi:2-methylcitrate dehydratase